MAEIDEFLNRKYKFDRPGEFFSEYLVAIGLSFINRKLASSIPSSNQLVKLNDREYALNTILPFMTHQQKFIPDEEIEQKTVDGRKVKNIFTIQGNKLIEKQIEPNREVVIVREFWKHEMIGKNVVDGGKVINTNKSTFVE